MSDAARKRLLADWVVRTKKQVVKLYATAKWARDADVAQKCMVRPFQSTHFNAILHYSLEHHRLRFNPAKAV